MACNTGNPIGSTDPRDAADNKENFDRFALSTERTYTDRLGVERKTVTGALQDYAAYNSRGVWTTATAYNVNDVWRNGPTGAFYLVLADYTSGASAAADIASGNVVVHQPKDWVVSVDTIADLRNLEPAFDGQQIELLGHTIAGVGGGVFYADFSSSAGDDNGVTVVTTGGRRWVRKPEGYVTPQMYGAVESGDSYSAILSAITSGYAVDFGEYVYQCSQKIEPSSAIKVDWRSNGARLVFTSATHQNHFISIDLTVDSHFVTGELFVDASYKANIGVEFRRYGTLYPSDYANIEAEHLSVENVRRELPFSGGTGLSIRGAFKRVKLKSPSAKNCILATGAGIEGIVGIGGIEVTSSPGRVAWPLYTEIINPIVDSVMSEDTAYGHDQDGIKVFGGLSAGDMYSSFEISGGEFKNCFGRSIKSQTSFGVVRGGHFVRNNGVSSGVKNPEIDFQGGQGVVNDITFDYDSFVPSAIVGTRSSNYGLQSGNIDGIRGTVRSATLPTVVITYSNPPLAPVHVKNIDVDGSVERFVDFIVPNDQCSLSLENASASVVSVSAVRALTGGITPSAASICYTNIRNVINKSTPVPLVQQRVAGNAITANVNATGIEGFTSRNSTTGFALSTESPAIVNRVGALFPGGNSSDSYAVVGTSKIMDSGAEYSFPIGSSGFIKVFMELNQNSAAIIFVSPVSGGRIATAYAGSDVAVDSLTEPSTGTLRIWCDGSGNIFFKNTNASSRYVHIERMAATVSSMEL